MKKLLVALAAMGLILAPVRSYSAPKKDAKKEEKKEEKKKVIDE